LSANYSASVTDDGLSALQNLPQLQYLYLDSTALTDRSLASVGRMKNLTFLFPAGKYQVHGCRLRETEPTRSVGSSMALRRFWRTACDHGRRPAPPQASEASLFPANYVRAANAYRS
jgi:hypothetical protein